MGMKELGVRDLASVEKRAFRLLSLGRISREDADYISIECGNLVKYIESMEETNGRQAQADPENRIA